MYYPFEKRRDYAINLEWCGYEKPRYVARHMGDWIGQSLDLPGAVLKCVVHKSPNPPIIEVPVSNKKVS